MGYLPADAPSTLALIEHAEERLFRSIESNSTHALRDLLPLHGVI